MQDKILSRFVSIKTINSKVCKDSIQKIESWIHDTIEKEIEGELLGKYHIHEVKIEPLGHGDKCLWYWIVIVLQYKGKIKYEL
jgi:hypothetical protein